MHLLVTGSSGLIGSNLIPFLKSHGHTVARLTRSPRADDTGAITWQPEKVFIDSHALEGFDAVVHLAGESVSQRWTPEAKKRIHQSRGPATQLLCSALARLHDPPQVLLSASATGYYGDRGDEVLTEASEAGTGFLAEVCREWEGATESAQEAGVRVVQLRLGIVLSPQGGALPKMLLPFRLGLGGPIGNGQQFWSWLTLDEAVGIINHALVAPALRGAVNAVSPQPVRNREFTQTLARVLHRPAFFPVPALGLRAALGAEQANELALCSARVEPAQLQATGYCFRHSQLELALRHILEST